MGGKVCLENKQQRSIFWRVLFPEMHQYFEQGFVYWNDFIGKFLIY